MTEPDLRGQLERLGVLRGVGHLRPEPRRRRTAIEDVIAGELLHTAYGPCFLHRQEYDPGQFHGHYALADLLARPLAPAALLARDSRFTALDPARLAFVDVETTGLAGGTGTYAFLIGVGLYENGSFVVYQFFMRDLHEEHAQLYAVGQLLDRLAALVTFNGKSFDQPLLETRFILARQPPRLVDAPHLDLLAPARRIWKHRLESCALSVLEREVLGVGRTEADVPGYLIPRIYDDYMRTGDARELVPVFNHNAEDILSLVTLASRLHGLLADVPPADCGLAGEDLYGLAGLLLDLGQQARAEEAYLHAARTCRSPTVREFARRDLAYWLKRQGRRADALPWWLELVDEAGAVYACEELAKHYEWRDADLVQAVHWTRRGIELTERWPHGPLRRDTLAALQHRLGRLEGKIKQ